MGILSPWRSNKAGDHYVPTGKESHAMNHEKANKTRKTTERILNNNSNICKMTVSEDEVTDLYTALEHYVTELSSNGVRETEAKLYVDAENLFDQISPLMADMRGGQIAVTHGQAQAVVEAMKEPYVRMTVSNAQHYVEKYSKIK